MVMPYIVSVTSVSSAGVISPEPLLTIQNSDPSYTGLGHSLSVSGSEIAIGAYGGQVIFRYDGLGNQLASYPSSTTAWAGFGLSVDYDGDRIVAGGPFYSTPSRSGLASVIDTTGGQILETTFGSYGSYYGWATALSESYYAVGTAEPDKVYVYDRQTNSQSYVLSSPDRSRSFGMSLAAEGDRLFVGAPRWYSETTEQAGAVYLYEASSQYPLRTFTSPNPDDMNFGWSVAQRDEQVLIGAPYAQVGGAAYLFNADTGALLQSFHNPSPSYHDRFGWSVAFSGNYVVIGATQGGGNPTSGGAAYAFHIDSGDLVAEYSDPAPLDGGEFGWAVAGLNNLAVVSGQCNGVGLGGVHFFPIPEPSTLTLAAMAAVGLVGYTWRRRRRAR